MSALQVVRLLQADAKRIEYNMYDIQDEIEAFPARIALAMSGTGKPKSRGLSKWLKKLRASLSKPVEALLKALGRPCVPRAHIRLGSTDDRECPDLFDRPHIADTDCTSRHPLREGTCLRPCRAEYQCCFRSELPAAPRCPLGYGRDVPADRARLRRGLPGRIP